MLIVDPNAAGSSQRFYRVKTGPQILKTGVGDHDRLGHCWTRLAPGHLAHEPS